MAGGSVHGFTRDAVARRRSNVWRDDAKKQNGDEVKLVMVWGGVGGGAGRWREQEQRGAARTHGDASTSISAITSAWRASVSGGVVLPIGKKPEDASCRTGGFQLILFVSQIGCPMSSLPAAPSSQPPPTRSHYGKRHSCERCSLTQS